MNRIAPTETFLDVGIRARVEVVGSGVIAQHVVMTGEELIDMRRQSLQRDFDCGPELVTRQLDEHNQAVAVAVASEISIHHKLQYS